MDAGRLRQADGRNIAIAARQLALRQGIAAFGSVDRSILAEQIGNARLPATGTFLERASWAKWQEVTLTTPHAVDRLQRYRQTLYWLMPRHRNLTQLVSHLRQASGSFVVDQLWCRVLLIDLAWLYTVALLAALDELTRLHVSDPARGLRQAVVGSEQDIREKERLASQLEEILARVDAGPKARASVPVVPDYFEALAELAARFARRRQLATATLRALEFIGVETATRGTNWRESFPAEDAIAAKLAADVVRFLVRAAGLDPAFTQTFDASLGVGTTDDGSSALTDQPMPEQGQAQLSAFGPGSTLPE